MSSQKAFVRDATGLVRDFNWIDGMTMGIAWFLPSIAFLLLFGTMPFLWPGSNLIITIGVFGTLLLIPVLLCYSGLAAAMPRSGGDYVYVSRLLSPSLGFAISVIFVIFAAGASIGFQGFFIASFLMAPQFSVMGTVYNNSAMLAFSQAVNTPLAEVIMGFIMLAATFVLVNIPTRLLHKLYTAMFVIAFVAYPIIFTLVFAVTSNAQFVSTFNSYMSLAGINTTYTGIYQGALQAGAVVMPFSWQASFAAIPFVMLTIAFPQQAAYIGGEVKNSAKQIPLGMAASVFATTFMTAIAGYFVYNSVGYSWLSAVTSWNLSGAPGYPLPQSAYLMYFVTMLVPNLAFNIFMLIAGIIFSLLQMIALSLMVSRALFAWAFDRVAPSALAEVSDRFHAPVKANVIALVVGSVFMVAVTYNFLGVFFNAVTAWTSAYIIVMISAALLPFTNKGKVILERSPAWVKKKIAGFPLLTVFGILATAALLAILYEIVAEPAISGATPASIEVIMAVYAAGFIGYYASKAYRKTKGIDIGLAFKEIPPE
jgi:amino acid transporter